MSWRWRFRKAINLGPARVNLNKKLLSHPQEGIGYSLGVPGLRWTRRAGRGPARSLTLSAAPTGLAYVNTDPQSTGLSRAMSAAVYVVGDPWIRVHGGRLFRNIFLVVFGVCLLIGYLLQR